MINFWATWCGPCIIETPELVELHEDLSSDGFTVVGISLDEEGFEVVEPFAGRFKIPYPLVIDDGTVADAYGGIYGLPTSFLIDKEGQIAARFMGLFPTHDMRPKIEEMMRESPEMASK